MLWVHMVIIVGLLSIILPFMLFLLMGLTLNNLLRSFLVSISSIFFTISPTFYIYSGSQLYIVISAITIISVLAGVWSYSFFTKHLQEQTFQQDEVTVQ
ncbi:hypothetical protein H1D32_15280 [Anaerobacillus sp. CMMVII]|uniref:hypothetical protein n=1 Tax=Anaerobacillus sp. CMMVII TaxID=2755588 RepID=UPI0021B7061B|nr:hypothetical protein [Anaerobacillus sp. CMMVII]MCT8138954.1 hypothetical protein [Anaerobacillus sp. CMMVII]